MVPLQVAEVEIISLFVNRLLFSQQDYHLALYKIEQGWLLTLTTHIQGHFTIYYHFVPLSHAI